MKFDMCNNSLLRFKRRKSFPVWTYVCQAQVKGQNSIYFKITLHSIAPYCMYRNQMIYYNRLICTDLIFFAKVKFPLKIITFWKHFLTKLKTKRNSKFLWYSLAHCEWAGSTGIVDAGGLEFWQQKQSKTFSHKLNCIKARIRKLETFTEIIKWFNFNI